MPWIWKNIGLPIIRYYFVATVRKVTLTYFSTIAIVTAANPITKLCFRVDWNSKEGKILASLGWEDDWIDITSAIIVIFITIAYCFYLWYEVRKLKTPTTSHLNEIKDVCESNEEKLDAALKRFSNTDITKSLITQLQDAIKSLHVRTADNILEQLKTLVLREKFIDYPLLMQLEYNIGRCMRFVNEQKSKDSFDRAYSAMEKAQLFDEDIVIAKIINLCKEKDFQKTDEIVNQLKIRNCNSIWITISSILASENPLKAYNELPVETKSNQDIIANLLLLDEGKNISPKNVDLINFHLNVLDNLSIDNLPLWALHFTVLQIRFLNEWLINPEIKNKKETKASKELYEKTEAYIKLHAKTELGNILPDIDFIHTWVAYIHDHCPSRIENIKKCSYTQENKNLYYIAVSSILISENKINDAVEFLGTYGEPADMDVVSYRLRFALQLGLEDTIKEIFTLIVSDFDNIQDNLLVNIFPAIQYFNSDVIDYIPKLNFDEDVKKQSLIAITLFFAQKPVDIEYLKTHINEIPYVFKPYIALIYEKYVGIAEAIAIVEPTVDEHYFDIRASVYFNLLCKDKRYGTKLYDFCERIRKNNCQTRDTLLCELRMAEQLEDWDRALEITTMMMNNSKQSGIFVGHYLQALFNSNKNNEIAQFYIRLKEYTYENIDTITNIFNIYISIDMYEEALEFLYIQVKNGLSQELRDFYYQASMNKDVYNIIHKQYDIVEIGSYVMINLNGKQEYVEILLGSQYDVLKGKKPGEKIDIELFNHIQHVEVLAVFNKYYQLYIEILKEISEHKSKTIRSFTIDDLKSGEGLFANLAKLSGTDGDYKKTWNESIEKYKNGEMTLYGFVMTSPLVADLYNKIFGDFVICSLPRSIVKKRLQNANVDITALQPVLDFSGLILMQELSVRFNLKFEKKFILPKSIETTIQKTILAEAKGLPSSLDSDTMANITIIPDDSEQEASLYVSKLKSLQKWIKSNCNIEINKDILNHATEDIKDQAHRMFIDSTMLTLNKNRVLISEDWVISLIGYRDKSFCSMSVANWLGIVIPESKKNIDEYILRLRYLGCEISGDDIYNAPFLDPNERKKILPIIVENIERFKHIYAVEEGTVRLLDGIIMPEITNYVLSIFIAFFRKMDYAEALHLKNYLQKNHTNDLYCQLVENAFKITHPIVLY